MRRSFLTPLAATAVVAGTGPWLQAQYAPPPPPQPFPGFLNQYLRQQDPYNAAWDIGGSFRMRFEGKTGFAVAGSPGSLDFRARGADTSNDYLMERLRVRLGYTDRWWSALVEGRSSFEQNDNRYSYFAAPLPAGTRNRDGLGPESDTLDLHQAYVTLGNHKEFPVSLKVGRQELSYGEERLVGAFGWNNLGRAFDATKLHWQNSLFGADLFTSRVVIPEDGRFNVSNDYDLFSGFYATSTTLVPKHTLEAYFLARNSGQAAISAEPSPQSPQPGARDIYTVGLRLKSKPGDLGPWDYTVESAYQFGNFRDRRLGVTSARLDHEAWMFTAQGGYTWVDTWASPRLRMEYAIGSGDHDPNDGKHGTFENLFPTNHKFYGYMDFVSLQNIHDVRGIFQLKPTPRMTCAVEGHGFWLVDTHDNFYTVAGAPRGGTAPTAGTNYGINPNYSNFVGTEIDAIAGFALNNFTQLEVGYGHFFTGDYILQSLSAASVGARDADFVYLQLALNF
jgi:hypothetical protein